MTNPMLRRDVLRLAALAAATPSALALAPLGGAGTAQAATRTAAAAMVPPPRNAPAAPAAWVVKPFANSQVTLGESLFAANRDRILNFLRAYPADRMLANFRANAGLDTLGAQPPGSWDDATGNLRGHYSGHFLSALALAYVGLRRRLLQGQARLHGHGAGPVPGRARRHGRATGSPAAARRQGEREVRPGGETQRVPVRVAAHRHRRAASATSPSPCG